MTDVAVHHPSQRQYWIVGGVLAVITGVEVAITYIDALDRFVAPALIALGVVKFAIVARWFMHLKFDKPLYSRFFLIGIVGALGMFTIVLLNFGLLVGN